MGFVKARYRLIGDRSVSEGFTLVDDGAWYTVVDEELAKYLGVRYTELSIMPTSFSGHKVACREAIVSSITVEDKTAPFELIAVCIIPEPVRELLKNRKLMID